MIAHIFAKMDFKEIATSTKITLKDAHQTVPLPLMITVMFWHCTTTLLTEKSTCYGLQPLLWSLSPFYAKKKERAQGVNLVENFVSCLVAGSSNGCLSTQPSLHEQEYYPKPTFSCEESPTELKTKRLEEFSEEEWSTMITAPFDGFLMIGTLGLEQILTEPSTPTFPMPLQKITEENAEVTENELKFINDELEKFLEAEAKEVGDEPSERSSYVSIITICGKQIEGVDNEEYEDNGECPLQEYLFGSSIELPEPNMQVEQERTSLGQHFKMNNIAHDHSTSKCEKIKKHARGTYAMRFIRKMLMKLHSSPPPRSSTGTGGATADPHSTKRKLPKVGRPGVEFLGNTIYNK